ncbi:(5-formylfuran-3-yl)methyl phosphate synthase [Rubinisphaera sp. JC750]|uniref:(5-formylfuran-3-yl)methyl phosphate synthase n=1 Tax=Rubinisphaera sp. JC750 TaxID=2898658 RepID=UPI001F2761F3|nr:(5-formylfuran-3-yl)methyl phosphate synthase [Rubinisphaera sp. JC750]
MGIRTEFWFRPLTDQGVLMPGLLISVRNAAEAGIALAGGCDVLDVKDPSAGSLGQPALNALAEILETLDQLQSSIPTSCALGELVDWSPDPVAMFTLNRLSYLKIGPAGLQQFDDWADRFATLQQQFRQAGVDQPRWIAAFYLDFEAAASFDPLAVLTETKLCEQLCERLGCAGILLDTFDKQGPSAAELILDRRRTQTLRELLATARELELMTAFAGRLSFEDVRTLQAARIQPDLFAVRSAVCLENQRQAGIEAARVRQLTELVGCTENTGFATTPVGQACDAD